MGCAYACGREVVSTKTGILFNIFGFDKRSLNALDICVKIGDREQRCAIHGDQPAGPAGPRGDGRAGRIFLNYSTVRAVRVSHSSTGDPGGYRLARRSDGTGGTRINTHGTGEVKKFHGPAADPENF